MSGSGDNTGSPDRMGQYVESAAVIAGHSVQSGTIQGDIHFHSTGDQPSQVVPRQLPAAMRHFVDRSAEQDALTTLANSTGEHGTSLISAIDGTAGVGKSTLVLHWGHKMRERFPDGELYVNLRGFDPTGEPMVALEALGALVSGLEPDANRVPPDLDARAAFFRSLLHDKRMLVVLDNALSTEHVRPLLPASRSCLVLVTSRSRLDGLAVREGAFRMTLNVLSHSEARELLGRYLGEHRMEAEPRASEMLLQHCAGLPLAIGVVAVHAAANPAFPLAHLAGELQDEQDRLDALDERGETGIRTVLSWSYRSLSEPCARLFRLLGLPTGMDISLETAASLADVPRREARKLLGELTEANLLEQHSPGRYRFHDLLRAYAAERAAEENGGESNLLALRRLSDHYLRTSMSANEQIVASGSFKPDPPASGITGLTFPDKAAALDWLNTERANLVSAVVHATRLELHEHAWQLPHVLRYWFKLRGYTDDWIRTYKIALDSAQRLGYRQAEGHLQLNLGTAHYYRGDYTRAVAHQEQARHAFEELADHEWEAAALLALGDDHMMLHDYSHARPYLIRALEKAREINDYEGEADVHGMLGLMYAELAESEDALRHLREALRIYADTDAKIGVGTALHNLADVYLRKDQVDEAVRTYRQAVTHRSEIGHRLGEALSLRGLGTALLQAGDRDGTAECWQRAHALLEELGHAEADGLRTELDALER